MQLADGAYAGVGSALRRIWAEEGPRGLYRGLSANALRAVPHSATRFVVYELAKDAAGVARRATDT